MKTWLTKARRWRPWFAIYRPIVWISLAPNYHSERGFQFLIVWRPRFNLTDQSCEFACSWRFIFAWHLPTVSFRTVPASKVVEPPPAHRNCRCVVIPIEDE